MNIMQIRKFQKNYHVHSPHIYSFNFKKIPAEIKKGIDGFDEIADMLFVRNEAERTLLINESDQSWKYVIQILVPLDNLPEVAIRDLYTLYSERYGDITADKIQTLDESETIAQTICCLLPEIMWTHGDDNIKSRVFKNN